MIVEDMVVRVTADTEPLKRDLADVQKTAARFSIDLSSAFDRVVFKGKSFSDVLRDIALRLSSQAFNAAFRPLESGLSNILGGLFGGLTSFSGIGSARPVTGFAKGGVIGTPTLFPMTPSGLGLMGEAGPEAVLPLARGPDGRLGVKAPAGDGGAVTVNVSIQTPDVEGFSRARGRISADLARAVDRGRRHL